MKFIRKSAVRFAFLLLTAAVIFFIFYMSSFDASDSSEMSVGVLNAINSLLSGLGINFSLTEHIVRKTAHFTEYFVLGGLVYIDALGYTGKYSIKNLCFSSLFCLVIAAVDEMSQSLSPGRTPQIVDVFIDLGGAFAAAFIVHAVFELSHLRHNRKALCH